MLTPSSVVSLEGEKVVGKKVRRASWFFMWPKWGNSGGFPLPRLIHRLPIWTSKSLWNLHGYFKISIKSYYIGSCCRNWCFVSAIEKCHPLLNSAVASPSPFNAHPNQTRTTKGLRYNGLRLAKWMLLLRSIVFEPSQWVEMLETRHPNTMGLLSSAGGQVETRSHGPRRDS